MKSIITFLSIFIYVGITYSQNVGIGNTNPQNTLHVTPQGGNDPLRIDGLNQYTTERNLFVVDPVTGVVKHMHIDSLAGLIIPPSTDNQNIDSVTLIGNILTVYIEDGSSANVDLSRIQDGTGTDDQNIDSLRLNGTNLTTYIEDGTSATIDLQPIIDSALANTSDDQNIDSLRLNGTNLTTYIEDGTSATIDLQPIIDSALANTSDDQNIDSLRLNGTNLTTYIEDGTSATIDLQPIIDSALANTSDDQNLLAPTLTGTVLTTNIENGSSTNIDLQPIIDSALAHQDTAEWIKGSTYGDTDTVIYAVKAKDNGSNIRAYNNGDFDIDRHYRKDGYVILTDEPNNKYNQYNLAIGKNVLTNLTTGNYNIGIGENSLRNNTTGFANISIGPSSLEQSSVANYNTVVGYFSMQQTTTGSNNSAFGASAIRDNVSGSGNSAFGWASLAQNINGNSNVAMGDRALYRNISGSNNSSLGVSSMIFNSTGSNNVAQGTRALHYNTTGSYNTSIGHYSNYKNITGSSNTAVGNNSLANNTYTSNNTAVGNRAWYNFVLDVASAINFNETNVNTLTNTIFSASHGFTVGAYYSLQLTGVGTFPGGLSNNSIYICLPTSIDSIQFFNINISSQGLGSFTLTPDLTRDIQNTTVLGANSEPTKSNQVVLGDNLVTEVRTFGTLIPGNDGTQNIGSLTERWNNVYAVNGTINTSDKRLKKEINESSYGLKHILNLKPVTYKWIEKENGIRIGFIAQDLQKTLPEVVVEGEDDAKTLGVRYSELIPVLTKAIQEQQLLIEELRKEINKLKKN